jgi:hypothetical protein
MELILNKKSQISTWVLLIKKVLNWARQVSCLRYLHLMYVKWTRERDHGEEAGGLQRRLNSGADLEGLSMECSPQTTGLANSQ